MLNPVDQQLCCLGTHLMARLPNCGEFDEPTGRKGHVVVADHGNVLWNAQTRVDQSVYHSQRDHVVATGDGTRTPRGCEQMPCCPVSALPGQAAFGTSFRRQGHAVSGKGLAEAVCASAAGGGLMRAGDHSDIPVTESDEMLCGHTAAQFVVNSDEVRCHPRHAAYQLDERNAVAHELHEEMAVSVSQGCEDQAVATVVQQRLCLAGLPSGVIARVREEDLIVQPLGSVKNSGSYFGIEGVGDVCQQQTNRLAVATPKATGEPVGPESQFLSYR